VTGSNNIDIGAGQGGEAGDSGVTRIGAEGVQGTTFVSGIYPTPASAGARPVVVTSSGHLEASKGITICLPTKEGAAIKFGPCKPGKGTTKEVAEL